jgi:hypothetical protein
MYRFYFFLFFLMVFGCNTPPSGSVSGTVTYQSKPLDTGSVIFVTKDKKIMSGADIDVTGHYQLNHPLPPGEYQITVIPLGLTPDQVDQKKPIPKWVVPTKYGDPENTPLVKTVQTGENLIDVVIE